MNKVYYKNGKVPLTPKELATAANVVCQKPIFTPEMFEGEKSRISGNGHCYCNGNGEFDLLPASDPVVKESGKRYMVCRKCGGFSHL